MLMEEEIKFFELMQQRSEQQLKWNESKINFQKNVSNFFHAVVVVVVVVIVVSGGVVVVIVVVVIKGGQFWSDRWLTEWPIMGVSDLVSKDTLERNKDRKKTS